ncbi:MAG: DUF3291 domain-containing protein [Actinomycetota bacterium]|nr:DUF3291 domain-containing protein [Actinomycetota bacterium]
MTVGHQLAQVNVALPRGPLDAPMLKDFMAALDPVNARADRAPGFVWRMQTADGDATAIRGFGDDPRLIINLTVWESRDAMRDFVYRDPAHVAVMRRRREWFERLGLHTALWWVPVGHRPTVREAEERLEHLRAHGPTSTAFTPRQYFERPDTAAQKTDDRWLCPA